jgi:hypothetical protein
LETEDRTRLRVEDEIADVDETADRGHDPERDRKNALEAHPSWSPIFALASAALCNSRARTRDSAAEASSSRRKRDATRRAISRNRRSFGSSTGEVLADASDLAPLEADEESSDACSCRYTPIVLPAAESLASRAPSAASD